MAIVNIPKAFESIVVGIRFWSISPSMSPTRARPMLVVIKVICSFENSCGSQLRNPIPEFSDSTTKCQSFECHKCWNDEKSTTSTNHSSDSTNHSSFKCCDEMFFPPNDTGTFLKMIYFSLAYYGTSRSKHNQSKEEQYECSFFNKSDMIRNTFDEEMTREIGSEKRWYSKCDHFVPKNL